MAVMKMIMIIMIYDDYNNKDDDDDDDDDDDTYIFERNRINNQKLFVVPFPLVSLLVVAHPSVVLTQRYPYFVYTTTITTISTSN